MAATPSDMVALGTPAPEFSLPEPSSGRTVSLRDFDDAKVLVVMFICNHCPFVKHVREQLARLGRDYQGRSVAMCAINSNDVENYPDDGPEKMAVEAREAGYPFAYLFDESQEVARAYRAACTPDFFVFGPDRTLYYRGQLDSSRPGNGEPVTGEDLRHAIDACLGDDPPPARQLPSMGCNIKWKKGNEPASSGNPFA